jgi:GT2 family glycosyltransferase
MEQNLPLISINLLTYNGQKYIQACLNAVFQQTYPRIKILIIDNASTDGTVEILKELKIKNQELRIIFNRQNLGFAAGHNQGIKESKGEFICCLNQDVVLDKDFIKKAVEVFQKDEKIAAVQGKLLRMSGDLSLEACPCPIDTTGLVMLKNRRIINRGQGKINQGQYENLEEIFGVDGAAPIYKRKALEDIKINGEYFDQDFFCYKEDVDLAWRLRLYGWKAVYQPKAVAWHWRSSGDSAVRTPWGIIKERRKISQFSKYLSFKNQRLMQVKNELAWLFFKHLPWIVPKEIAAWFYVLCFERYTWKAVVGLLREILQAWQKRKIIMTKKRVGCQEMERWFE